MSKNLTYVFKGLRAPCTGQNWLFSVLTHIINPQNIQVNAETKSSFKSSNF